MNRNRGNFSFQMRRNRPVQQQQQQQQNAKDQSRSYSLNAVPPPSSLCGRQTNVPQPKSYNHGPGVSKHGYHTIESMHQYSNTSQYSMGKRRGRTEDEYFDEEDEPTTQQLEYIPAPGSPSAAESGEKGKNSTDEEDEEDPLDAFMAGIEEQVKMENKKIPQIANCQNVWDLTDACVKDARRCVKIEKNCISTHVVMRLSN